MYIYIIIKNKLELCEAFVWSAIWGVVSSNELILCSRGNSGSSFPAAGLMRANFIIVFYQIGLSSVFNAYLATTRLIGSNALKWKEIPQINFLQGTPVNWNAFQLTTSCWLRECQECAKLSSRQSVATLKNIKYKIYFDWFNTFLVTTWFHMCYFIAWCLHYYSTM